MITAVTLTRMGDLTAMRAKVEQLRELLALYNNAGPETEVMKLEVIGAMEAITEVLDREYSRIRETYEETERKT